MKKIFESTVSVLISSNVKYTMDLICVKHGGITENKNYKKKRVLTIIKETAEVSQAYNEERTLTEFNTLTASEAKQISDSSTLYI